MHASGSTRAPLWLFTPALGHRVVDGQTEVFMFMGLPQIHMIPTITMFCHEKPACPELEGYRGS